MASDKEFDRSVCFMFYESYLTQSELIKEQYGADEAYSSLAGIIKYALYKEEPTNMMAKIVLEGLKNTIDAGQAKRAQGFASREDSEMTEKIIQYKKDNPNASYNEIKDALGCSKGKVTKVLKNFSNCDSSGHGGHAGHGHAEYRDRDRDQQSGHAFNSNSNNNSNSNSNNNTVTVTVTDGSRSTGHDGGHGHDNNTVTVTVTDRKEAESEAAKPLSDQTEQSQNQSRILADLSIPEKRELVEMYDNRVKYNDMYEHFSLSIGSLDKNKIEKIKKEIEEYDKNKEKNIIVSKMEDNPVMLDKLSDYLGYSIEEVKENVSAFKMQPDKLIDCLESESGYIYKHDYWLENTSGNGSHWKWIADCYDMKYNTPDSYKNCVVGSNSDSHGDGYDIDLSWL